MRIKYFISFLFFLLPISLYSATHVAPDIHRIKLEDNQPAEQPLHHEDESLLTQPIEFSTEGLEYFLTHVYNHIKYSTEILPSDFSHFTQFLGHVQKTKQPEVLAPYTVRLFFNKLKASPYVNAYAFAAMLQNTLPLIEGYFNPLDHETKLKMFQKTMNDMLNETFLSHFSSFKQDPDTFLENLSENIIQTLITENQMLDTMNNQELRTIFIRFLELGLSKLIWNPEEPLEAWNLVKATAHQLTIFYDKKIIDTTDNLNDLFITLVERYCFFIELTGSLMPLSFYEAINEDLEAHSLLFLELQEQEQFIESKARRLCRALFQGEAQSRAREQGIVPQNS